MPDFATYQKQAQTTAVYPNRGEGNFIYPALGLAGETGEQVARRAHEAGGGGPGVGRRGVALPGPGPAILRCAVRGAESPRQHPILRSHTQEVGIWPVPTTRTASGSGSS